MSHRKHTASSGRRVRGAPHTQATCAPLALLLRDPDSPDELRRTITAWSQFIDQHLHDDDDELQAFARLSIVRRAAAHMVLGEHEAALSDVALALSEATAAEDISVQGKALEIRALVQTEQNNHAGALATFAELWPLLPMADLSSPEEQAECWLARGKCHARLKHYEEAISDFSQAIALATSCGEAWCWRGLAHAYLDHWDQAETDASQALALEPENATFSRIRGVIRRMANRFADSLSDLLRAETLGGDPLTEQSKWETLCKWLLVEGPNALEDMEAVLANADREEPLATASTTLGAQPPEFGRAPAPESTREAALAQAPSGPSHHARRVLAKQAVFF